MPLGIKPVKVSTAICQVCEEMRGNGGLWQIPGGLEEQQLLAEQSAAGRDTVSELLARPIIYV